MFLIDKPYVSSFLVDTISAHNFKLIATPVAQSMIVDNALNWITEEEAIATFQQNPQTHLYSNAENALDWIDQYLEGSMLSNQIRLLKDKAKFRTILQKIFPHFFFKTINIDDIPRLSSEDMVFPFVIKPTVGFFSIGVHIIHNEADWKQAKNALKPEQLTTIFPECVVNTSQFIIEAYIEGEEYAIDYYHNDAGEVVILNILQHIFSSGTDTSDRVYTTSKQIINDHKAGIEAILHKIGQIIGLRNFPAHAEVRIDKSGQIIPIEINPLRFGGWCTTADLAGITLGFNPYQYFFNNKKPDWDAIFAGREDKKFSLVVLDNNSGIDAAAITHFDYDKLANDFENPIAIRALNIKQYPVFGFVFLETPLDKTQELQYILTSNLKKYIT